MALLTPSNEYALAEAGSSLCLYVKGISRVSRTFWLRRVRTSCYQAFYAYTASIEKSALALQVENGD